MNPFQPPPANAAGVRGFASAAEAKASAMAQPEVKTFGVLQWKQEFAWVAPLDLVMQRMGPAMFAGINLVEMVERV